MLFRSSARETKYSSIAEWWSFISISLSAVGILMFCFPTAKLPHFAKTPVASMWTVRPRITDVILLWRWLRNNCRQGGENPAVVQLPCRASAVRQHSGTLWRMSTNPCRGACLTWIAVNCCPQMLPLFRFVKFWQDINTPYQQSTPTMARLGVYFRIKQEVVASRSRRTFMTSPHRQLGDLVSSLRYHVTNNFTQTQSLWSLLLHTEQFKETFFNLPLFSRCVILGSTIDHYLHSRRVDLAVPPYIDILRTVRQFQFDGNNNTTKPLTDVSDFLSSPKVLASKCATTEFPSLAYIWG